MTAVTSDQLLVTSLEDNTIPVFEVYNPSLDRPEMDVVFLLILVYLSDQLIWVSYVCPPRIA